MEQNLTKPAHQSSTKQATKPQKLSPQARTHGGVLPWELRKLSPEALEAYYKKEEEELQERFKDADPLLRRPDEKQSDEGKVYVDLQKAREKKQLCFYKVVGGKKVPATGPTFSPAPPL